MTLVVRAFPVLKGKEEEMRRFAGEMAGARSAEAAEFYRSFDVARESWHLQETPNGPIVIGVTEVADPEVRKEEYSRSERPFDRWFKDQVRTITGIDPEVEPLGPPTEVIFDSERLGSGS